MGLPPFRHRCSIVSWTYVEKVLSAKNIHSLATSMEQNLQQILLFQVRPRRVGDKVSSVRDLRLCPGDRSYESNVQA